MCVCVCVLIKRAEAALLAEATGTKRAVAWEHVVPSKSEIERGTIRRVGKRERMAE